MVNGLNRNIMSELTYGLEADMILFTYMSLTVTGEPSALSSIVEWFSVSRCIDTSLRLLPKWSC